MADETNGPNSEQIDYWNGDAGDKWVDAQERLDPVLEGMGLLGMDQGGVNPGERVIDIGCGCGATSLELARRVGPMGSVLGVDISSPMLRRAAERAAAESLGHAVFANADASSYQFEEGAADLVFSRFGVMFFRNSDEAFTNIRRGMRPGGRLCFVCWQPLIKNAWVTLPRDIALRHVPPPEPPNPDDPGPFAFADPAKVEGILGRAGFSDAAMTPYDTTMYHLGSVEEVTHFMIYFGPASRLLEEADNDVKTTVEAEVRAEIAARHDGEGVAFPAAVWVATATT
ncbi:MAG: SAM-dependent methyltransferase [Rhodospirillaceae bacterium]|nr:SAM-dependent methyltransferase [Rhodospirillaceae bacterium]|tara:strand:- start:5108 stop:5962 length:855 start_codon:yes stop_codon:yes gene_type:complete